MKCFLTNGSDCKLYHRFLNLFSESFVIFILVLINWHFHLLLCYLLAVGVN